MARRNKSRLGTNMKTDNSSPEREQPRKDSRSKRVNFDNARVSQLYKDISDTIKQGRDYSNAFKWYNNNPNLIQAAGRITFSSITGMSISEVTGIAEGVPGVMSLEWTPRLGPRGNVVMNQAAQDYYSYVVHANSRNTSYEAADLMMLTLGVGEVFSALCLGIRAYGTMREFKEDNLYSPQGLIEAMGFNFPSLQSSYSRMWFDINYLIAQTNQFWIPDDLPFIDRRMWLNSYIYTDSRSSKGQFYLFKPEAFYTYEPTTDSRGGRLVSNSITYSTDGTTTTYSQLVDSMSWSSYVTMVQNMINALNTDEDRGIIMGDILKAYGQARLRNMKEIPIDYKVDVVYDPVVLMQIENAIIQPTVTALIAQDDNQMYARSALALSSSQATTLIPFTLNRATFLNVHHLESPSVEEVVEMTRFTCLGTFNQDTSTTPNGVAPYVCGTESLVRGRIYQTSYSSSGTRLMPRSTFQTYMPTTLTSGATANTYTALGIMPSSIPTLTTLIGMFDWAPMVYNCGTSIATSNGFINHFRSPIKLAELDNYTILQDEDLKRIHDACVFSEFGLGTRV